MENVLESVLEDAKQTTETPAEVVTTTEANPLDLDFSEYEDETEEDTDNVESDEEETGDTITSLGDKEGNAFASMRVQNKEYKKQIEELDAIAKANGLKDYKEFLDKAKENSIAKKAKEEGISVELAKKLEDIDSKFEEMNSKEEQSKVEAKEAKLASTLNSFVKTNSLDKVAIDKLSNDLNKDGFTIQSLMEMPESAVLKLFSAYTNLGVQKILDKKSSISQEMPVKQTSKIDGASVNSKLDDFVKEILGKK